MSNCVRTCLAAVAATASLLLGGGGLAVAADVGPAPAPPGDQLPPAQSPGTPDWVAVPVGPPPAAGTAGDTIGSAPAGGATANVLQVNPIDTCISCTSASAGAGSASARATAIRLLGNNISAGESSGGSNSGALLAIPANPLLGLAVADWMTAAAPGSSAHSRAAVVDLALGPNGHQSGGLITVAVLEATSDAGYRGVSSGGSGANNGVDLDIGDGALVVLLLHSDASSSNTGSAYVVSINGNKLLGSEQTGAGGIPIAVPGVIGLILLQVHATGGAASSSVGTAGDLLGQSGQAAGVLTASAVGLSAPAAPVATPATGSATTSSGLTAPNTGLALGISGLVILPAGLALLLLSLRNRRRGAAG